VLIAANADLTYADSDGMTALLCAAYNGHASTCCVLVDEGAPLTAVNSDFQTPLELAKRRGNAECVAIIEAAATAAALAAHAFVNASARGFRFAVTMAANKQAPPGLDKHIWYAAKEGKLVMLLRLCKQWAGHTVIDAYKNKLVCQDTNTHEHDHEYLLAYTLTKQTNKRIVFVSLLSSRMARTPCSKLFILDTKHVSACSSLLRPMWRMRIEMA